MLSKLHNCPQHVSQHQMWGLCRIQVRYWMPRWRAPWQQSDYSYHASHVINGRRSHPHPHTRIRKGLLYGLTPSETCSVHANDKQKQHKCVCTHTCAQTHVQRHAYIPGSINQVITSEMNHMEHQWAHQSHNQIKWQGHSACVSLCLCVGGWVCDRVSSSRVFIACQLIFKGYKYGLLPLKLWIILVSVCVSDRVCSCVCVCVFQVYSHWLNEPAVCVHVSPPVRALFAHI